MKVKLINTDKEITVKNNTTLLELSSHLEGKFYAGKVNGFFRELNYKLVEDCEVELLTLLDSNVVRMYEAGLRYLFAMATFKLYPEATISFHYNVSRSILAIVKNLPEELNESVLEKINAQVREIINRDYPIKERIVSYDEAKLIYKKQNYTSKLEILNYTSQEYVHLYDCDGYCNYMYSQMVPSTRYLDNFKSFLYGAGFIIQYPRYENNGQIPEFNASESYANSLRSAYLWNKKTEITDITSMNKAAITDKGINQIVNLCEIKHTNNLYELAQTIYKKRHDIRLICIAGPSSSGKTTFAKRLTYTLRSLGLKPTMISIDDYYLPKDKIPIDEHGERDFEHIEALDIKKFNSDMKLLVSGKPIVVPRYNFSAGDNSPGSEVKAGENEPIIIEGIHALNEILTDGISKKKKFFIYISPQTQLQIDVHNPISITDLRLLRRIVRDSKFRNSSAEDTMSMWPSVRRGEFKWIYPHQDHADYVFSTELAYEFMVLRKHALKTLHAVERSSKHSVTASRLVKFLDCFMDIPDEYVPCNSLLREFIGGRHV